MTTTASQGSFLNDLAMYETSGSLALSIACLVYMPMALKFLKQVNEARAYHQLKISYFYMEALLFSVVIYCLGGYPSPTYSTTQAICVYQGFLQNTGSFASFLLSLALSWLLYTTITNSDNVKVDKLFVVPRWQNTIIIFFLSLVFASILGLAFANHFCTDITYAHATVYSIAIALIFYIPLILICLVIIAVFMNVWEQVQIRMVSQPHTPNDDNEQHVLQRQVKKLVILQGLGFVVIVIVCFLPGMIRKIVDFSTDYDGTPFVLKVLDVGFRNAYGAMMAILCFYIAHFHTTLSVVSIRHNNIRGNDNPGNDNNNDNALRLEHGNDGINDSNNGAYKPQAHQSTTEKTITTNGTHVSVNTLGIGTQFEGSELTAKHNNNRPQPPSINTSTVQTIDGILLQSNYTGRTHHLIDKHPSINTSSVKTGDSVLVQHKHPSINKSSDKTRDSILLQRSPNTMHKALNILNLGDDSFKNDGLSSINEMKSISSDKDCESNVYTNTMSSVHSHLIAKRSKPSINTRSVLDDDFNTF